MKEQVRRASAERPPSFVAEIIPADAFVLIDLPPILAPPSSHLTAPITPVDHLLTTFDQFDPFRTIVYCRAASSSSSSSLSSSASHQNRNEKRLAATSPFDDNDDDDDSTEEEGASREALDDDAVVESKDWGDLIEARTLYSSRSSFIGIRICSS